MSIFDQPTFTCPEATDTAFLGSSMAESLYSRPLTIDLIGELGAGKTTFVQGLSKGLMITDSVVSPTFALEQRFGDVLCHIDLCRLSPMEAADFLQHSNEFPGVRVIEWADRSDSHNADISIEFFEKNDARLVQLSLQDIRIPSDEEIQTLWKEAKVPSQVRTHMEVVADVADRISKELVQQGRCVRPKAVRAAALLHDILRYVDFASYDIPSYQPLPDTETKRTWNALKDTYGQPHESAGARYLEDKGLLAIAMIMLPHRGSHVPGIESPKTIEQKILCYADKRVEMDRIVPLSTRFDLMMKRHAAKPTEQAQFDWRDRVIQIERELFPLGPPF